MGLELAARGAPAQPMDLSRRPEPGQEFTYETKAGTEAVADSGGRKVRSVSEQLATRTELVIEAVADPPGGVRVAEFRTGLERQTALQEDGRDALAGVPPQNLERQLPPVLSVETRRPKGVTGEAPAKLDSPAAVINAAISAAAGLPARPVKAGDAWTENLDFGLAKVTVTSRLTEVKDVGGKPCAVIESAAQIAFVNPTTPPITVEKLSMTFAEALDGSGPQWTKLTLAVLEKGQDATRRVVRTSEMKLVRSARLTPEQLQKARADLQVLSSATREAQGGDLDKAIEALAAYIHGNPEGPWTPAVRSLHNSLVGQRVLTKPTPAIQLRAILRDLQVNHDRAMAAGNTNEVSRLAAVLRQVAKVNLEAIAKDAGDGDPLVRDLAAFALAFSDDPEAPGRLQVLAADNSPRVRGTAALALVIQGKPVKQDLLLKLLRDIEERTRGAAALLASRTLKRDTPDAAAVVPLAIDNLLVENPWARLNNAAALKNLAPIGSRTAVGALVNAWKREKRDELKAAYVAALKAITGLAAETLEPYEQWLAKPPAPKG
jgi:hypothetical protein